MRRVTRSRLLQAAGEVFADRGYRGATVRRICARARANVALVNYHFGGKLGLYTEVLRESVHTAQLEKLYAAFDRGGDPGQVLRTLIRIRLRSMCGSQRPDWHLRIVMHEFAEPSPALARVIHEALRPAYNRLLEVVGSMLELPPGHEKTRLCAHSIMGQMLVYGLARPVLTRLWPELKMSARQVDRIADHISEFSLAYLRNRK